MNGSPPRPERFSKAHRLRHDREFQHVYEIRHRRESGPLLVYAASNTLTHPRLGLSVSRKVGGAVTRNRVKRRLRESFRKLKVRLDRPFDYVIVVRPHKPITQEAYQTHLETAMQKLADSWTPRKSGRP
ncbi:MAG: ribonuclease P protein component [Phycisphaerales bacterium]|nr:ribonuclease P protein component [Phycisphaerales bacterium]